MGFSAKQVQALRRQPSHRYIRTREAHGRELTYLEGWYAISEANRIFGFDGWNRETVESKCVLARENRGTYPRGLYRPGAGHRACQAAQPSSVKAMAPAKDMEPPRARCTTLPSRPQKPMPPNGHLPPSANPLALSFIGAAGQHCLRSPCPQQQLRLSRLCPCRYRPMAISACIRMTPPLFRGHPATMAAARIWSRAIGRRVRRNLDVRPSADTSIVPASPGLVPAKIDKSLLAIAEPRRLRDKAHLKIRRLTTLPGLRPATLAIRTICALPNHAP